MTNFGLDPLVQNFVKISSVVLVMLQVGRHYLFHYALILCSLYKDHECGVTSSRINFMKISLLV
jgi:hypothetical protein